MQAPFIPAHLQWAVESSKYFRVQMSNEGEPSNKAVLCKLKRAQVGRLRAAATDLLQANASCTHTPQQVSFPHATRQRAPGLGSAHPTEVHVALRANHVVAPTDALDARAAARAGLGVAGHPPLIKVACCITELGHEGLPFTSLQAGRSLVLVEQHWTRAGLGVASLHMAS